MDIHVEAPDHTNFTQLEDHYKTTLSARYTPFEFIKVIEAKVRKENGINTVKLIVEMEKDPKSFVVASDLSENKAFKKTLQKLDQVVRKYKSKHYHGI